MLPRIPTIKEIKDNILSNVLEKIYANKASIPMLERSGWVVVALAFAGVIRSCYEFTRYVMRQIFTSTADLNVLTNKGNIYNIKKFFGSSTILNVSFTGVKDSIIPEGTQISYLDFIYKTLSALTIDSTLTGDVNVESTTEGYNTTLNIGIKLTVINPIVGVDNTATVKNVAKNGTDPESIEAFRTRITRFERAKPQGGAIPDFVQWAKEVPNIVECYVIRDKDLVRQVNLYPLTNGSTGSKIPTNEQLREVEQHLITLQPPCISKAFASEVVTVAINVISIVPNTDEMKVEIVKAFNKYALEKRPVQFLYEEQNGSIVNDRVSISSIYAAAQTTDVLEIELEINITPSVKPTEHEMKIGEILEATTTWLF